MELKETIDHVRALILQGETGQALPLLIGFLEQKPQYKEAVHTLTIVASNYNEAKQQEIKGILSFQEAQRAYSKANDAILYTLQALEGGRPMAPATNAKKSYFPWAIGAAFVLLLGLGLLFWWQKSGSQVEKQASSKSEQAVCPNFASAGPRILLIPFQKIAGQDARPENVLRARIQEKTRKNNFKVAIEILSGYDSAKETPGPGQSKLIGTRCDADMVIYGFYNNLDSLQLDAEFVFPKQMREGGTGFLAIRDLIDLQSSKSFKPVDDAVLSLCGFLAARIDSVALAEKWFGKIQKPDLRDKLAISNLKKMRNEGGLEKNK